MTQEHVSGLQRVVCRVIEWRHHLAQVYRPRDFERVVGDEGARAACEVGDVKHGNTRRGVEGSTCFDVSE